jgi:hypothetical protein
MAVAGIVAVVLFVLTANPDALTKEPLPPRQFQAPGAPHMTASDIAEIARRNALSEE